MASVVLGRHVGNHRVGVRKLIGLPDRLFIVLAGSTRFHTVCM